jgi:hypothetical protein
VLFFCWILEMFQQCDICGWFLKIKSWPLFGKDNVIFKLWIFYYYVNLAVFQQHQYEVPISHLILWCINCVFCHDVHDRGLLPTNKLLNQWFLVFNMDSSLRKIYGRHHDHVCRSVISCLPHSWLTIGVLTRVTRLLPLAR